MKDINTQAQHHKDGYITFYFPYALNIAGKITFIKHPCIEQLQQWFYKADTGMDYIPFLIEQSPENYLGKLHVYISSTLHNHLYMHYNRMHANISTCIQYHILVCNTYHF